MISEERIMGFVEGEGCFSIGIQKYIDRKPRKTSKRWGHTNAHLFRAAASFRIALTEEDRPVLEEIRKTLGIGQIYVQKSALKNSRLHNSAHYYVESLKDCQTAKEFFQRQKFYTKKGKDFRLWCQVLELIQNKAYYKKEGLLEICRIRDQMNYLKTKNKRSTKEIEEILNQKPLHLMSHFDENQEKLIHNKNFNQKAWLAPKQGNHIKGRAEAKVVETLGETQETPNISQNNSGG